MLPLLVCLLSFLSHSCATNVREPFADRPGFVITLPSQATPADVKWGKYLFSHLQKRASQQKLVSYLNGEKDYFNIQVSISSDIDKDFKLSTGHNSLSITARNENQLLWLMYQLMRVIGEQDAHFDVSDLPPAVVSFSRDSVGVFPFEYREAYLPENNDPDFSSILGMNNVNADWGLWGHHLSKAIGKDAPSSVYATVDGNKYEDQYCFSAEETYKRIENYIFHNYGDGTAKSYRFAIFPNDDDCVCTCSLCKAAGNTSTNATPAVTKLLIRLAKRFPKHLFFTSSYLSTKTPATEVLPANTGVIISAIDFPLKSGETKHAGKFTDIIERWQRVTKRIYVWDYINNFDDYFSPFPVLSIMQERLQYYEDLGVSGVFLNGSGDNYSAFSGLHNFALSALLVNPYLSVATLVSKYFNRYYPSSASVLIPYYNSLDQSALACNKALPLYGGIDESLRSFLLPSDFIAFYNKLGSCVDAAKGDERKQLHQLYIALSRTRLELARISSVGENGCVSVQGGQTNVRPVVRKALSVLQVYKDFPAMHSYKEALGSVGEYIDDWNNVILPSSPLNLLLGKKLQAQSLLDEGYEDLSVLTDGVHGLPSDYHCGWLISSLQPALVLNLPVTAIKDVQSFNVTFLHYPRFKLAAPKQVELLVNGKLYKTWKVSVPSDEKPYARVRVGGDVQFSEVQSLVLRIVRADGKKKNIACDEIQFNR